MIRRLCAALVFSVLLAAPASAAQCGGDYNAFIAAMARDAAAAGVSRGVIDQAFAGIAIDQTVLSFDRRQRGTFRKSFEDYAATRVIPARIKRASSAACFCISPLARLMRAGITRVAA